MSKWKWTIVFTTNLFVATGSVHKNNSSCNKTRSSFASTVNKTDTFYGWRIRIKEGQSVDDDESAPVVVPVISFPISTRKAANYIALGLRDGQLGARSFRAARLIVAFTFMKVYERVM